MELRDIGAILLFCLVVAGIIFCLIQVYNIFTDNPNEGDILTKKGFLIDVINTNGDYDFIFNDDTYLDLYSIGEYNISYLDSFVNSKVEIRYTSEWLTKLVSIKTIS